MDERSGGAGFRLSADERRDHSGGENHPEVGRKRRERLSVSRGTSPSLGGSSISLGRAGRPRPHLGEERVPGRCSFRRARLGNRVRGRCASWAQHGGDDETRGGANAAHRRTSRE